jgi:hypothetical protein
MQVEDYYEIKQKSGGQAEMMAMPGSQEHTSLGEENEGNREMKPRGFALAIRIPQGWTGRMPALIVSKFLLKNIRAFVLFYWEYYKYEYRMKLKNGVDWDVMSCGSCKNRHFGGT